MGKICISFNYDFDNFNEVFLNVPPAPEDALQPVCKELNKINSYGYEHYRVVDDFYVLKTYTS